MLMALRTGTFTKKPQTVESLFLVDLFNENDSFHSLSRTQGPRDGVHIQKHFAYDGDWLARPHHQETWQDRAEQALCGPGIKQS